jgi:hypothetical protein
MLMSGIQNLVVGKVIPTPFGRPDVIKMMQTKTPKRVFFISIARPSEEATKEKVLKLIESCSRVAFAGRRGVKMNITRYGNATNNTTSLPISFF